MTTEPTAPATPKLSILTAQLRQSARDYLQQRPPHNSDDLARWIVNQRPEHAAQLLAQLFAALSGDPPPPAPEPDPLLLDTQLNDRQIAAIRYLAEHKRVTTSELRTIFPHLANESLRLDLTRLEEKGLVLRIGRKRGTFYMLRPPTQA